MILSPLAVTRRLTVSALLVAGWWISGNAEVLYTLTSPNPGTSLFGSSVSRAGDVDNDGHDDVLVGAPYEHAGASWAGRAYVFGGNGGTLLHTLQSPNPESDGRFGECVSAAGDVDNDGFDDVVVGAHLEDGGVQNGGRAYIFSGQTGTVLYTLQSPNPQTGGDFGRSVSAAGDVDNDGHGDVIVGAPSENGGAPSAGRAYIFSGATGLVLHTLISPIPESYGFFGTAVSGAGDTDGDGYDEVLVGAFYEDGGAGGAGRAYILSTQPGVLPRTLLSPSPQPDGHFGRSVSLAGDVDSDGTHDVIVGASEEDIGTMSNAGRAHVFSGGAADLLYTLESPNPEPGGKFGRTVSGAVDVNGDSHSDLVIAANDEDVGGVAGAGRTYVFSGIGGILLYTLESPLPTPNGEAICGASGVGDVDNDGYDEVIIGSPMEDYPHGRAYVFDWMILSGALSAGDLQLQWSPWVTASAYWVYGADNKAYFTPGLTFPYPHRLTVLPSGTTTWASSGGIGDPANNWTYMVLAVDASQQVLASSNRFGEHDFDVSSP
jgi:hypothetical protein